MIFLVPQKSFKKKIEKWVTYKDFFFADAMDRHDGGMYQYGNRINADDLSPTPTLILIATADEDNKEAMIKKRRVNLYLETWLNDEGVNLKLHYLVGLILRHYRETGEDLNIFIVMRNPLYYAYHEAMERHINEEFQCDVCASITHKMSKDEVRKLLTAKFPKEFYKTLKQSWKRVGKAYHAKPEESMHIDELNQLY